MLKHMVTYLHDEQRSSLAEVIRVERCEQKNHHFFLELHDNNIKTRVS
jgi:hypothetical protein